MVKRNINFCEEKKNYYKNINFARIQKFILWESFCFGLFGDGKYGLLLIQKDDVSSYFLQHGKPCFFEYGKVPILNFSEIGNTVFFYLKSLWKVDIFLVFLKFSWYFRTWQIWLFVQFCFKYKQRKIFRVFHNNKRIEHQINNLKINLRALIG